MILAKMECPLDGLDGQIQFLFCPKTNKVFIMCDECYSIWVDPEHIDMYHDVEHPREDEYLIAEIGCTSNEAREATRKEIIDYGWAKYIGEEV